MNLFDIFLIGLGLSMDAFAVSISKGLSFHNKVFKKALVVGLYFGIFQALMPFLGYLLGNSFADVIYKWDRLIAFIILTIIGINMISDSPLGMQKQDDNLDVKTMSMLAIATSIDALIVGITFSFNLSIFDVLKSIILIGITTFIICLCGVFIGNIFGNKYKEKSTLFGGIILILIGIKILLF